MRICSALVLSYLVTFLILLGIAYAKREVGQMVGTVSLWQEIEVQDFEDGEFGNISSDLPFFWVEIGASKKVYAQVKNRTEYVPYFGLTTEPRRNRFKKGLYVEVWDYDWALEGEAFSIRLKEFFPIARDEIIRVLNAEGIEASPTGTIIQSDERDMFMFIDFSLLALACIPASIVTVLVMKRKEANKSPQTRATSGPV